VGLGFVGVDWEVDWGGGCGHYVSLIALEVTGIVSIGQKGYYGCNNHIRYALSICLRVNQSI